MTDNEIIKALACCGRVNGCVDCKFDETKGIDCIMELANNALDLINKRKAEIARLTAEKDALIKTYGECMTEYIKDFVKKLKEEQYFYEDECGNFVGFVPVSKIDELAKEMTEEEQ